MSLNFLLRGFEFEDVGTEPPKEPEEEKLGDPEFLGVRRKRGTPALPREGWRLEDKVKSLLSKKLELSWKSE